MVCTLEAVCRRGEYECKPQVLSDRNDRQGKCGLPCLVEGDPRICVSTGPSFPGTYVPLIPELSLVLANISSYIEYIDSTPTAKFLAPLWALITTHRCSHSVSINKQSRGLCRLNSASLAVAAPVGLTFFSGRDGMFHRKLGPIRHVR